MALWISTKTFWKPPIIPRHESCSLRIRNIRRSSSSFPVRWILLYRRTLCPWSARRICILTSPYKMPSKSRWYGSYHLLLLFHCSYRNSSSFGQRSPSFNPCSVSQLSSTEKQVSSSFSLIKSPTLSAAALLPVPHTHTLRQKCAWSSTYDTPFSRH